MPADILLYALIAGGLVFWLRSILGTRHGDEKQRPNPFTPSADQGGGGGVPHKEAPVAAGLNNTDSDDGLRANLDRNMSVASNAEDGLMAISKADRHFSVPDFLQGAQDAFVMIVEAFAAGDRETLKDLLSDSVYKSFESAIRKREEKDHDAQIEIHSVRKADIIKAWVHDKKAFVTVRFTSDETNLLFDENDKAIAGDPERITETIDIWTFGRSVNSRDPRWFLYETRDEDAAGDDHKTVPDSEE